MTIYKNILVNKVIIKFIKNKTFFKIPIQLESSTIRFNWITGYELHISRYFID